MFFLSDTSLVASIWTFSGQFYLVPTEKRPFICVEINSISKGTSLANLAHDHKRWSSSKGKLHEQWLAKLACWRVHVGKRPKADKIYIYIYSEDLRWIREQIHCLSIRKARKDDGDDENGKNLIMRV